MWWKLTHDLELVLNAFLLGWVLDFHCFDHQALLGILERASFVNCAEPSSTDYSINKDVVLLAAVLGFY